MGDRVGLRVVGERDAGCLGKLDQRVATGAYAHAVDLACPPRCSNQDPRNIGSECRTNEASALGMQLAAARRKVFR